MVPARPRSTFRRPRGSLAARAVDGRLVRNASLVLIVPLLVLLFTTSRTGPLPAPELPPAFGGASALRLTQELARDYPSRIPGTSGAARAVRWYEDRLGLYGLTAADDRWRQDVPGLGETELVNLVTIVPGRKEETIVVIAHRDNDGSSPGANDNASGTAALVELLRGYAATGTVSRRFEPDHTLVFVSSDGGAYGALGAARFADRSPLARRAVAVLSLDGLAGHARPRLELSGPVSRSPAPALVRTAAVRAGEQLGDQPAQPGPLTQLVDLALPFGYGEQAAFLARGRSAVRLTTSPDVPGDAPDDGADLDGARLGQLGRAAEATLSSLDEAVQLSGRSASFLYLGDRVVRGWAVQLLLVIALVPFGVATVDLLVRSLRRGTRLAPAGRRLRGHVGLWVALGGVVFVAALLGVFPSGDLVPPLADAAPVDPLRPAGLLLAAAAGAALWAGASRAHSRDVVGDPLAGYTVAFAALAAIGVVVALANPFALIFLLPSLYTWLWLPSLRGRAGWLTDGVYGLGLAGPVLCFVVLAEHLGIGLRTAVYAVGLATSGTVSWVLALCMLAWAAVAQYVAHLVAEDRPRPAST
jgi:hypothetical protein